MFHLFNRVYLENDQWYTTQYDNIILNTSQANHPISRVTGIPVGNVRPFDEFLIESHGGEVEQFWQFLMAQPTDKNYIVYADQPLVNRLQIQYWKSIFVNQDIENHYKMYKFYTLDKHLKRFMAVESKVVIPNKSESTEILSLEQFKELFDSLSRVDDLVLMEKSGVSFEYLLANFYMTPESLVGESFLKKLEELSWNAFFDNLDILRNEILNSFYDIKKIVPGASINLDDIESTENFILNEPRLKWIADTQFWNRNKNYILKNYQKETFTSIISRMQRCTVPQLTDEEVAHYHQHEDHIKLVNCIFDRRYKDFLDMNIAKGFGCFFISDDLNTKANQILPLFIYEKIREKKLSELEFLKLS